MRQGITHNIDTPEFKLILLKGIIVFFSILIIGRLFYLQVIRHNYYQQVAAKEHYGYTELPARRGEIFIKDYASNETVRVATNVTLDTLYADPTLITNKQLVADTIAPLIFNLEAEKVKDAKRIENELKKAVTEEERNNIKPLSDEELYTKYHNDLLENISREIRPVILLSNTLEDPVLEKIKSLNLTGFEVKEGNLYAYPVQITNREKSASELGPYLNITPSTLEQILRGKNRYTVLAEKVSPEITASIRELKKNDPDKTFFGLGLEENYYRFYPEHELAANVMGFVTPGGIGQYGIESNFNSQLQGKIGVFQTQKDGSVHGRQITVGESVIQPAVDGDDIVLTIDRSMQMTIEKMLAQATEAYRADSGQVIVMDPKTGKIMAMAHFPSFDPNSFSTALETVEIKFTPAEIENLIPIEGEPDSFWFYRNVAAHDRFKVMRVLVEEDNNDDENSEPSPPRYIYKRYKNWIGLEAYQNKIVGAPFEPGSIFKAITMASAIDDKDVTPTTAIHDSGVLKVDEFEITNVSSSCSGYVTMTNILENSCNTGMGWIAQQMGKNLFYSYIIKFGLGERTGIEFDNEHPGKIEHFSQWAESELVTHAFGQGITATPLQMATAYSVIANGGTLVQPYIVEKVIQKNGKVIETGTNAIHKVITTETAQKVTAMLISAVENGVAKNAQIDNHYIAAKTGTAQTYRNGKPLKGAGTTIASIAGFGPIENPKFVLLVKFDRPRSSEWADSTSAYLFKDIATYLYEYLGVPPDKK